MNWGWIAWPGYHADMQLSKYTARIACVLACSLLVACALAPAVPGSAAKPAQAANSPEAAKAASGAQAEAGAIQSIAPAVADAQSLRAQYAALLAGGGRVMQLQPAASSVRILVFRAGRSANLGHNHVLSAPEFDGFFYLPDSGLAQSQFELRIRLDQLVFDVPAHRAALGPAFAAPLSDAAIAATRQNMLGPGNMQAERYPEVRIRSVAISGEAPTLSARLAVDMHGQSRELDVPLRVTGLPERLQVSGVLVLRQSDFGVQPFSVLGGLLAVQDAVQVEFTLIGQ